MAVKYPVVEKFISINGEGLFQGYPAVFIRFAGCNLNCSYCDTTYAQKTTCPHQPTSKKDLVVYVAQSQVRHVTITGGEPLLQDHLDELLDDLTNLPGITVELETNGSVAISPLATIRKQNNSSLIFTLDYKLPSSLMESHNHLDNFNHLTFQDSVKFVIGNQADFLRACQIVNDHQLPGKTNVIFSPVYGKINSSDLVAWLLEKRLSQIKVQLQIHKYIWDPQTKGV